MQTNPQIRQSSRYALLELTLTTANVTPPMSYSEMQDFVKRKYGEQPLNYFNGNHALWVINITDRTIRALSLKLEL